MTGNFTLPPACSPSGDRLQGDRAYYELRKEGEPTTLFPTLAVVLGGGGGGGPTLVDSTAVNAINTNFTVTKPAGVQSGDFLVFLIYFSNNIRTISSAPAGTVQYLYSTAGSLDTIYIYTKVAGGSEPANYTFANDGISDRGAVICVALRGGSSITSSSTVARSNGTGASTSPSFTASDPGYQMFFGCIDSSPAPTVTSQPTDFVQLEYSPAAFNSVYVGGKEGVGGGSILAQSITWNNVSTANRTNISFIVS